MAGMLPGVECARRRRFHQGGDSPNGYTRRSSFCLYTSNHESSHSSTISSLRSILNKTYEDEKLGGVAREAKERLDERLKTQRRSEDETLGGVAREAKERLDERLKTQRRSEPRSSRGSLRIVDVKSNMVMGELQTEVFGSRKSGSKRFSWTKLSSKAADQDECIICLDKFKSGETLVHLPCAHRYHSRCLLPWLENNAHCPCCRMEIHVEFP